MSEEIKTLAPWRRLLTTGSLVALALSAFGTVICWTSHFPLIHLADGVMSTNPWDERLFWGSVFLSLLTSVLALFGRGLPRILLVVTGLLLLVLSTFGYVSNHV